MKYLITVIIFSILSIFHARNETPNYSGWIDLSDSILVIQESITKDNDFSLKYNNSIRKSKQVSPIFTEIIANKNDKDTIIIIETIADIGNHLGYMAFWEKGKLSQTFTFVDSHRKLNGKSDITISNNIKESLFDETMINLCDKWDKKNIQQQSVQHSYECSEVLCDVIATMITSQSSGNCRIQCMTFGFFSCEAL